LTTKESLGRKQRVGTVVGDKMDKSIVVSFSWTSRHRIYGKARRRATKFHVHDENNQASLGDIVRIEETRPLSKTKHWRLVEIVKAIDVAEVQPSELDPEAGAIVSNESPNESEE
jgi:small subunit ribosomal protein S17